VEFKWVYLVGKERNKINAVKNKAFKVKTLKQHKKHLVYNLTKEDFMQKPLKTLKTRKSTKPNLPTHIMRINSLGHLQPTTTKV
jgi:hypothetical protein